MAQQTPISNTPTPFPLKEHYPMVATFTFTSLTLRSHHAPSGVHSRSWPVHACIIYIHSIHPSIIQVVMVHMLMGMGMLMLGFIVLNPIVPICLYILLFEPRPSPSRPRGRRRRWLLSTPRACITIIAQTPLPNC